MINQVATVYDGLIRELNDLEHLKEKNDAEIRKQFGSITAARTLQLDGHEAASFLLSQRDEYKRMKDKLRLDLSFMGQLRDKHPEPRWAIMAEMDDDGTLRTEIVLRDKVPDSFHHTIQNIVNGSILGLYQLDKVLIGISDNASQPE